METGVESHEKSLRRNKEEGKAKPAEPAVSEHVELSAFSSNLEFPEIRNQLLEGMPRTSREETPSESVFYYFSLHRYETKSRAS